MLRQRNKKRAECDRQRKKRNGKTKTERCNEKQQKRERKYSKLT